MGVIFTDLLDWCESAINDEPNSVWVRSKVIQWAEEGMRQFPILRPATVLHQVVLAGHSFSLPLDFREIVAVEFPTSQIPPAYLTRKSHFDADFYDSEDYFDVDYNFSSTASMEWTLWTSAALTLADSVRVYYLGSHLTGYDDNGTDETTISEEHAHIIVAYVLMKGYKERLSTFMQDPTAYSGIIGQMAASVIKQEEYYFRVLKESQDKLSKGKAIPGKAMDKFDRVY